MKHVLMGLISCFQCAACSACVVVTCLTLRFYYGRLNKIGAKDASGKDRIWLL